MNTFEQARRGRRTNSQHDEHDRYRVLLLIFFVHDVSKESRTRKASVQCEDVQLGGFVATRRSIRRKTLAMTLRLRSDDTGNLAGMERQRLPNLGNVPMRFDKLRGTSSAKIGSSAPVPEGSGAPDRRFEIDYRLHAGDRVRDPGDHRAARYKEGRSGGQG